MFHLKRIIEKNALLFISAKISGENLSNELPGQKADTKQLTCRKFKNLWNISYQKSYMFKQMFSFIYENIFSNFSIQWIVPHC